MNITVLGAFARQTAFLTKIKSEELLNKTKTTMTIVRKRRSTRSKRSNHLSQLLRYLLDSNENENDDVHTDVHRRTRLPRKNAWPRQASV
jgi:hypothetical protein